MNKKLLSAILCLVMVMGVAGEASATTTVSGAMLQFQSGLAQPTIDFNKGGSQIYEDGHLRIVTDDVLYLDPGATVQVEGLMTPAADDTYDFGKSIREWKDFYLDGLAYIDQLGETLDSNAQTITNIGNAGTDFLANGGLTLANAFTVTAGGATVTAGGLTVTAGDVTYGTTVVLTGGDTASLNGIDAIGATTETTLEASIDALANLVTVGTIGTGVWQGTEIANGYVADDITASSYLPLAGGTMTGELVAYNVATSSSTDEGAIYYDTDDDNLYVYADGSFVDLTASAGGGDDLDTVYNNDAGGERTVIADAGSVSWDLADMATDYHFIVDIQGGDNEFKIQDGGTDKFTVADAGAVTSLGTVTVGVDDTGADVTFYGATSGSYLLWDESEDRLEFDGADVNLQDSDILQFGDAQDIAMAWDGTDFDITQAGTNSVINVGVDDAGMDFKLFGDTTGQYMLWDQSADKLVLYGTMDVGVDDTGYDVKFFGATASSYMLWDESADELEFDGATISVEDSDQVKFGDADDITMAWDGTDFDILQATANSVINVGVDDAGMDFKLFGDTTGQYMLWDQSADKLVLYGTMDVGVDDTGYDVQLFGATSGSYALWDESDDRLEFDGADVNLQDNDILQFGDAQDASIRWDGTDLDVLGAADDQVWKWGNGTESWDMWWYGNAAGDTVVADASANLWTWDGIDLRFNDADILEFGNAQDVQMRWDATDFDVLAAADDYVFNFGAAGGNAFDVVINGDVAGESLDWDASSAEATVKTTVADTTSNSGLLVEITDNTATSGDGRGVYVDVKDGSASPVAAIDVLAEDTDTALGIGARIQAAASATITKGLEILAGASGVITTALDVSDDEIATAVSYGANTILGTGDIGSTSSEIGDVFLADDKSVQFGSDQDATIMYDETTDDQLEIDGAGVFIGDTLTIGVDDTGHDVTFYGATASSYLLWDESDDRLELDGADVNLQDADILQFGDAQDVTMTWSGTAFNIAQAGDGQAINVGADDNGMDFKVFGETSGDYVMWDESADKLILIGTMDVGVDDTGHDVKFFGATSGAYLLWDESADELELDGATISVEDADQIKFGDADDITMAWDGSDFDILQLTANSSMKFGVDGAGIDVVWYGDTASSTFTWDQSADKLILDGSDIQLSDDDILEFGDTPEVQVQYDEDGNDNLQITGTGASLYIEDVLTLGKQAETIDGADDSVTITASYLEVTATAATDDIILATTGVLEGDLLFIVNVASNTFQLDGGTATMKIDGGADLDVPQYDGAIFIFDGTNWLQLTTIPGNS